MRALERLLRLATDGDLALEPHVLAGELCEHAVDGAGERIEFRRAAPGRQTARKVALDDRGRGTADLLHLRQQPAADHPSDRGTQRQNDDNRAANPQPEALDERVEEDALAGEQEVVSVRQHHVRTDHPHRRSAADVDHETVGAGRVGNLCRPGGQIAGEAVLRRVGEDHDLVAGQACRPRGHRCGQSACAFPGEHFDQRLQLLAFNICLESRKIRAPAIPERNREQGERQHTERDVSERQPGRGKTKGPHHVWIAVKIPSNSTAPDRVAWRSHLAPVMGSRATRGRRRAALRA